MRLQIVRVGDHHVAEPFNSDSSAFSCQAFVKDANFDEKADEVEHGDEIEIVEAEGEGVRRAQVKDPSELYQIE